MLKISGLLAILLKRTVIPILIFEKKFYNTNAHTFLKKYCNTFGNTNINTLSNYSCSIFLEILSLL